MELWISFVVHILQDGGGRVEIFYFLVYQRIKDTLCKNWSVYHASSANIHFQHFSIVAHIHFQ